MIHRPVLSQSIRAGAKVAPGRCTKRYILANLSPERDELPASCPLGAAFLGTLHGPADIGRTLGLFANSSDESTCQFILQGLMRSFPQLGQTVRSWPKLAGELEREPFSVLPPTRHDQLAYRREVHMSLYRVITRLHDDLGKSKEQIADLLQKHGL